MITAIHIKINDIVRNAEDRPIASIAWCGHTLIRWAHNNSRFRGNFCLGILRRCLRISGASLSSSRFRGICCLGILRRCLRISGAFLNDSSSFRGCCCFRTLRRCLRISGALLFRGGSAKGKHIIICRDRAGSSPEESFTSLLMVDAESPTQKNKMFSLLPFNQNPEIVTINKYTSMPPIVHTFPPLDDLLSLRTKSSDSLPV